MRWELNPWCAICTVLDSRPRSRCASTHLDLHSFHSSRLHLVKRLGEGQFTWSPPLLRCCAMYLPQCSFSSSDQSRQLIALQVQYYSLGHRRACPRRCVCFDRFRSGRWYDCRYLGTGRVSTFSSTRRLLIDALLCFIRRGFPMSFFTLVNMTCTGFGPMVSGWVEYDPRLRWRWIQWLHAMLVSSL